MPETATVAEHPTFTDAQERVVELRRRRKELQEELEVVRFGEDPDVEELAAAYDGRPPAPSSRSPAEIRKEIKVVELALVKARGARSTAKQEATRELLEEFQGPYRQVQQRLAAMVTGLLREAARERAIRERARQAGLKPAANPQDWNSLPEAQLRKWLDKSENFT